jgi:hypothetical protein
VALGVRLTKETAYKHGTCLEVVIKSPEAAAAAAQAAAACRKAVAYSTHSNATKLGAAALGGFEPVISLLQLYRLDGNLMSTEEQSTQQYEIAITMANQLGKSWSLQLVLWMGPEQQPQQHQQGYKVSKPSSEEQQQKEQEAPRKLLSSPTQPVSPSKPQQQAESMRLQPDSPMRLDKDASVPRFAGPGARLQNAFPVLVTARKGSLSSISHASISGQVHEAGSTEVGSAEKKSAGGSSSQVMWVGAQAAVAYREEVLGAVYLLPAGAQLLQKDGCEAAHSATEQGPAATAEMANREGKAVAAAPEHTGVHWVRHSWVVRPSQLPGQQVVGVGLGLVAVATSVGTSAQSESMTSASTSGVCIEGAWSQGMHRFFLGKCT